MTDMRVKVQDIYSLEQLSEGHSALHRLHPGIKLMATLSFLVTLSTFDRYGLVRLIPYLFYTSILISLADIPVFMLLKRTAVSLPFCLFAGLSNVFFDEAAALSIGNLTVSYGVISFFTLLLRTFLCVSAVLILAAVTPLAELTGQLRRFRAPAILIIVFEMTYRYIGVLADEVSGMRNAYMLRSANRKGVDIRHAGSFIGCLLLRSVDRAERIYEAMKCRGYALGKTEFNSQRIVGSDWLFLAAVCMFCTALRIFDFPELITRWIGGWMI